MDQIKITQDQFVSAVTKFKVALSNAETAATDLVKLVEAAGAIDATTAGYLSGSLLNASSASLPLVKAETSSSHPSEAAEAEAGDKTRGKKKAKKIVDPNAPKRPLPAVLRFLNGVKREIRAKREENNEKPLPMAELNELAQEAWQALPEETQQEIKSEHEIKMKEYKELSEAYKAKKASETGDEVKPSSDDETKPSSDDEAEAEASKPAEEESPKKKSSKRKKAEKEKEAKSESSPKKKSKKNSSS